MLTAFTALSHYRLGRSDSSTNGVRRCAGAPDRGTCGFILFVLTCIHYHTQLQYLVCRDTRLLYFWVHHFFMRTFQNIDTFHDLYKWWFMFQLVSHCSHKLWFMRGVCVACLVAFIKRNAFIRSLTLLPCLCLNKESLLPHLPLTSQTAIIIIILNYIPNGHLLHIVICLKRIF